MARILSISYDPSLLTTRHAMLEAMGHTVVSAEGFANAYQICVAEGGMFDLIILGHSIPHDDKVAIVKECQRTCACPVLALLRPHESPIPGAAGSVYSSDPQAFLDTVAVLTKGR